MKRKYSFAIVLLLVIIAAVTGRLVYFPSLEQLFFVPFTFFFYLLLLKAYPTYAPVFFFAAVALGVSMFANDFNWEVVALEFILNIAGTLFTLALVSLYRHCNPRDKSLKEE